MTLQFAGPLTLVLLRARRRSDVFWGIAAAAGVALLAGSQPGVSPVGVAFALAAAAITAAGLLVGAELAERTSGLDGLVLALAVAALVSSPLSVQAATGLDASQVPTILAVGALAVAVPYSLEYLARRRVGIKAMGVLLSLDPALAALTGLAILGQTLSAVQLAGIVLVTVASIGITATS